MVDHRGNVVDGDEILYLIARDRRAKYRYWWCRRNSNE